MAILGNNKFENKINVSCHILTLSWLAEMSDWIAPERLVMAATRRVIPWLFTSFRFSSIWSLRCSSSITSWCLFSFFSSLSRNVWANTDALRIMVEPMLLLLTFLRFELESCVSLDSVSDDSDFSRIKQYFDNDQKHKKCVIQKPSRLWDELNNHVLRLIQKVAICAHTPNLTIFMWQVCTGSRLKAYY